MVASDVRGINGDLLCFFFNRCRWVYFIARIGRIIALRSFWLIGRKTYILSDSLGLLVRIVRSIDIGFFLLIHKKLLKFLTIDNSKLMLKNKSLGTPLSRVVIDV